MRRGGRSESKSMEVVRKDKTKSVEGVKGKRDNVTKSRARSGLSLERSKQAECAEHASGQLFDKLE